MYGDQLGLKLGKVPLYGRIGDNLRAHNFLKSDKGWQIQDWPF